MKSVKIQIEVDEWSDTAPETRARVLSLMQDYGYDTKALEGLQREVEPSKEDIFRQFYGDED